MNKMLSLMDVARALSCLASERERWVRPTDRPTIVHSARRSPAQAQQRSPLSLRDVTPGVLLSASIFIFYSPCVVNRSFLLPAPPLPAPSPGDSHLISLPLVSFVEDALGGAPVPVSVEDRDGAEG